MNFKEARESDIDAVFDLTELAEEHSIDGRTVTAVITSHLDTQPGLPDPDGQQARERTVHVRATDLPKPRPGRVLKLDGESYLVDDAEVMGGILTIKLKANDV